MLKNQKSNRRLKNGLLLYGGDALSLGCISVAFLASWKIHFQLSLLVFISVLLYIYFWSLDFCVFIFLVGLKFLLLFSIRYLPSDVFNCYMISGMVSYLESISRYTDTNCFLHVDIPNISFFLTLYTQLSHVIIRTISIEDLAVLTKSAGALRNGGAWMWTL